MRISNQSIYSSIKFNLASTSDSMLQANQVISSGKRINRLSDDPVGQVSVMSLRSSLENLEQMERNINVGRSWLNAGETAMSQIQDILTDTKVLCIEMANATQNASTRAIAAEEVEGSLEQILSLANTQVDGRYIFSGTTTDTAPYSSSSGYVYGGNDTEFEVNIAKGINVAVGRVGTDVFGSDGGDDNIFQTLTDLQNSLSSNDIPGIHTAMEELDDQMNRLGSLIADTGAKETRLDVKENIIQDLRLVYTDRKSTVEDADMAEAVMNLKARETAYQAALASASKVMNLSLVNFL